MATDFLTLGPADAPATLLLAHGAGAPMDSAAMTLIAESLADQGLRVARFEFAYMAARREGYRRPPPRAEKLTGAFEAALEDLQAPGPVIIGGKSLGGRVASLIVDEAHAAGRAAGLVCFGYPFHPPGRPNQLRTAHLEGLTSPALICQGTRDPFGAEAEVKGYALSPAIKLLWLEDGDHDLKPRKKLTGRSHAEQMALAAKGVADWTRTLPKG